MRRPRSSLLRQANPSFQLLKPRIGSQNVHRGIDLKKRQASVAIPISHVEPLESLIDVAQGGMNESAFLGAYAVFPDSLLQFVQDSPAIREPICLDVHTAQVPPNTCSLAQFLKLRDGFLILSLCLVHERRQNVPARSAKHILLCLVIISP